MAKIVFYRRRDILKAGGCLSLSVAARSLAEDYAGSDYPFSLGVASGDPSQTSVVLWTRLAPELLGGTPLRNTPVLVRWELASDSSFTNILAEGTAVAQESLAHSVHVELDNLIPDRRYYYRFIVGKHISATGRTRTLPAAVTADPTDRLHFVTASCQDFTQGYFNAYAHIAEEDLNFVLHLGDYIYDWPHAPGATWSDERYLRRHVVENPETLDDFRQLHAQYKQDRHLQRAHAAHPWIVLPDNHDGVYDSASATARRSAALQAFYEHMPMRLASRPDPESYQMRRHFTTDVGDLARFVFLDTRQYKDPQSICGAGQSPPIRDSLNPSIQTACPAADDVTRSMLGQAQRQFLFDSLKHSNAQWNFIVSPAVMATFDFQPPNRANYLFGWDGYTAERRAILAHIKKTGVPNPVVLSGDWHTFWVNRLSWPRGEQLSRGPVEFATSGVSSGYPGNPQLMENSLHANPHVRYLNTRDRGYMRFALGTNKLRVTCVAVDSKAPTGAPKRDVATFELLASRDDKTASLSRIPD